MSSLPITAAQSWHGHQFTYCRGQADSRIKTGEDYPTRSLSALWTMAPDNKPKSAGLAMIPSSYCDFDARSHEAQRANGSFVTLAADIDGGNHSGGAIQTAVEAFTGGAAWLIYSSAHSRPGDTRWRIILPLAEAVPFATWYDAQTALFTYLDAQGIKTDRALSRAGQLVYLPNVPHAHKTGTPLRDEHGQPLHFERRGTMDAPGLDLGAGTIAEGIAALRRQRAADEQERAKLKAEAERRRAARPAGNQGSLIDDFNAANTIADMLAMCGYTQCPRHDEDWRSPQQTGETYATRVMGSKWVSLSGSDAASGLGEKCAAGCYGDAFDLFAHYKHGGDRRAALRQLGAERRSDNVTYPPQFHAEPPEWMAEAPMPEADDLGPWEADYEAGADYLELAGVVPEPTDALQVVDAFDFNEADIPTRPWIIPGIMLSGYTHMLAAPGGSGKSLFTLQVAIALARGEAWGEIKPRRKARTLVINVEDDIHEQRRRLAAARRVMNAPVDDLRGMVHLVTDTDGIIVAGFDEARRVMTAKPIVPVLVDYIRRNEIDVLIVDPFTETFEGDENDNSEVKWAMRIWRDEIARATGCVVYLVHHTTKYAANGAGDANVVRGAGAIVNSTRISATLMPMTQEEAAAIGIEEADRHLYVRYDDAKANQSLKSGRARWFQKQSVTLANGDDEHPADEVGALMPWNPPGMLDGVSLHSINAVLDRIDAGLLDAHGAPLGSRYTASARGGTKESGRWAGCVLIDQLGMKEAQASALVKTWIKNGVLVEKPYHDAAQRKERTGLFAPENARPGAAK